jgi:NADH:ubiquinone oxidoreductase subunit 5 (subunit L)/multisubunit Na+/H+ antiporter MnhA subunit
LFVFFSSWTSLYGAFVSLYQSDLKKILAYSTISHCGILMFLSVFNNLHVLIFYLYIHGFFKSLSFMCVGNIIKTSQNIQDFRYMGQKYFNHRYEYYFLIFSLSNLSGYGLSMGFFAKHYICMNFFFLNPCLYFNFFFFVMTALCGFFYSFNLINFVFFSFYKGYSQVIIKGSSCTHTSPAGQVLVISVLNIQSLFILIYLSSFIYCSKFYELKFNFFLNFSSLDSIFFIDKSNFVKLLSLIMWVLFGIFLKTIFYRNFIYLFNFVFMYIFALIF